MTPTSLSGSLLTSPVRRRMSSECDFWPMFDDPVRRPQRFVLLLQSGLFRLQLLHPQMQIMPAIPEFLAPKGPSWALSTVSTMSIMSSDAENFFPSFFFPIERGRALLSQRARQSDGSRGDFMSYLNIRGGWDSTPYLLAISGVKGQLHLYFTLCYLFKHYAPRLGSFQP